MYMVGCESLQMILKSIPDLGVRVRLTSSRVFFCFALQSYETQRGHCVCM